jgi:hypothetical protein
LVVEGFNGYRVESNDVDKIFDKIQTFYKSSDYLKINLYNNCKNFAKKYDIEIATQKYITY